VSLPRHEVGASVVQIRHNQQSSVDDTRHDRLSFASQTLMALTVLNLAVFPYRGKKVTIFNKESCSFLLVANVSFVLKK
jgi:hypothetical protein